VPKILRKVGSMARARSDRHRKPSPHNGILVALSELLEKAPNLNVPPKVQ